MSTEAVPSNGTKWKDEYYIDVYCLAASGAPDTTIAKILGTSYPTFSRWVQKRPALAYALDKARRKGEGNQTFLDYCYGRLSPKMQDLWNEVFACDSYEDKALAAQQMEQLLSNKGKRIRQQLFLHAMVHANFNISEACRLTATAKNTYDGWMSEPDFKELMEEFHFHKKNFFESHLVGLVRQGDSAATIFANKTINRDRGYNDKLEIHHSGSINHNLIDISRLDLPIEMMKAILDAWQKLKTAPADANPEPVRVRVPASIEE